MNSDRLYFQDPSQTRFRARVVRAASRDDGLLVVLDRTAFYPEGGGQPADLGLLDESRVLDVQEVGGEIEHLVRDAGFLPGQEVIGQIDAARRLDHMQQHSGQHLLSRTFVDLIGAETVAFHLGRQACTIDLPRSAVSATELEQVEAEVARVIGEHRPITAAVYQEGDSLPAELRRPTTRSGSYRVVSIDRYDHCPCGGTHVGNTAEIGAVLVCGVERIRDGLCRVEFLCGERVRGDHRRKLETTRQLVRLFSVEEAALVAAAERTLERLKQSEKARRELRRELLPVSAERLLTSADSIGPARLVIEQMQGADGKELGEMGRALIRGPGVVAVLCADGEQGQLVVAASKGSGVRADLLLRQLLEPVGGRGGGSEALAQGGFADGSRTRSLLDRAGDLIRAVLLPPSHDS